MNLFGYAPNIAGQGIRSRHREALPGASDVSAGQGFSGTIRKILTLSENTP